MFDKFEKRILQDTGFVGACLVLLFISMYANIGFAAAIMGILIAWAGCTLGVLDMSVAIRGKPLNLFKNKKGIVFTWAIAAITIGFTALVWWVVSYPLMMVIETMEGTFTYPAEAYGTIQLVKNVLGWFLGIEVIGVLFWALISSFRRTEQQYPVEM
jgi:hypothetical protein